MVSNNNLSLIKKFAYCGVCKQELLGTIMFLKPVPEWNILAHTRKGSLYLNYECLNEECCWSKAR